MVKSPQLFCFVGNFEYGIDPLQHDISKYLKKGKNLGKKYVEITEMFHLVNFKRKFSLEASELSPGKKLKNYGVPYAGIICRAGTPKDMEQENPGVPKSETAYRVIVAIQLQTQEPWLLTLPTGRLDGH